jgi:hypothetical protein
MGLLLVPGFFGLQLLTYGLRRGFYVPILLGIPLRILVSTAYFES